MKKGTGSKKQQTQSAASTPQLCCACHDCYRGRNATNLPRRRFMCSECFESITCYVCDEQRSEELTYCGGCGWRAAHFRCLGLKAPPSSGSWFCFRCEDPKSRAVQEKALPILDSRVHQDYLLHATAEASGGSTGPRKRPRTDVSTVAVPPSQLARLEAGEVREHYLASRGLARMFTPEPASQLCPHCACENSPHLNFCGCCGLQIAPSKRILDHVPRSGFGASYVALKHSTAENGDPTRLPNGRIVLGQIIYHGDELALVATADLSAVEWIRISQGK